jgi:hypothetical protein
MNVSENEKRATKNEKRETRNEKRELTPKHLFEILQMFSFGLALWLIQAVTLTLRTLLQKSVSKKQNKSKQSALTACFFFLDKLSTASLACFSVLVISAQKKVTCANIPDKHKQNHLYLYAFQCTSPLAELLRPQCGASMSLRIL